jgi:hypothetical protein
MLNAKLGLTMLAVLFLFVLPIAKADAQALRPEPPDQTNNGWIIARASANSGTYGEVRLVTELNMWSATGWTRVASSVQVVRGPFVANHAAIRCPGVRTYYHTRSWLFVNGVFSRIATSANRIIAC